MSSSSHVDHTPAPGTPVGELGRIVKSALATREGKLYLKVGGGLIFLTVVTICVYLYDCYFGDNKVTGIDLLIGLSIATAKVALVLYFFMHLNHEAPMVYRVMCFTVFFCIGLFLLSILAYYDPAPSQHSLKVADPYAHEAHDAHAAEPGDHALKEEVKSAEPAHH